MVVNLLVITSKQLISISFESFYIPTLKKSISHENLNMKDISNQQQFFHRKCFITSDSHQIFLLHLKAWKYLSLTNVRACEPEPFSSSLEPLFASHCFFPYLSIFSPFFMLTVYGSSPESIWRWKSVKYKQTIARRVLCTLFTLWCAYLQPGRIYCCWSISEGSSNFFSASQNFWHIGWMIQVKKWPTRNIHITTQSSDCSWEPQIQLLRDLLLSISNQHFS